MNQSSQLPPAVLLVGPTGAGKSPLGEEVQRRSGWVHFDFGVHLRTIAAGTDACGLDSRHAALVRELVETNALFPDAAFPVVRRIVGTVLARSPGAGGLILNGLPRTIAQAEAMDGIVALRAVVFLDCPAEVAIERVARRESGQGTDHAGRGDDTPEAVRRKLTVFEEKTRPLLQHYRDRGVPVRVLSVGAASTEEDMADQLGASLFGGL